MMAVNVIIKKIMTNTKFNDYVHYKLAYTKEVHKEKKYTATI